MVASVNDNLAPPGDGRYDIPGRVGQDLAANVAVGACETDGGGADEDGKLVVVGACPNPVRPLAGSRRYRARLLMH